MPNANKSGFTHEVAGGQNLTDHWLTPPALLEALGGFDLDPCAYFAQPWRTAAVQYALPETDGLLQPWSGCVWCNPPYGDELGRWIERMALHDNGIMLVFSRTETLAFRPAWKYAKAMLYLYRRVRFISPGDFKSHGGGGAGSVLLAFGDTVGRLRRAKANGWDGALVEKWID